MQLECKHLCRGLIHVDFLGSLSFSLIGIRLERSGKRKSNRTQMGNCWGSKVEVKVEVKEKEKEKVKVVVKEADIDPPSDVKKAFQKYSNGATRMTAEQLLRFIQCGNGGTIEKSNAERIVKQVLHKRKTLKLNDFFHYLFNPHLNPPIGSQVHQDMNAPLSHYFIYTSHNSYLTDDRLISPCSDAPIIEALKRGIRGIELDLWPDTSKRNVVVRHGRGLTAQVDLERCLKSIKEHAFDVSPYPVIIVLEDHLTPDLQAKVAQMITETFGTMLFCHKSGDLKGFPTPKNLKYRILISTKPPREYLEAQKDNHDSPSVDIRPYNNMWKYTCDSIPEQGKIRKHESDNSCPAYNNLIAIHLDKPNVGLMKALKVEKDKVKCLSLAEQAIGDDAERHQKMIKFTQKNLIRIYPTGLSIVRSIDIFLFGWLHGAQMIAVNLRADRFVPHIMHAMFKANGGCGYVKKPEIMMADGPINEVFNRRAKLRAKKTLKVKLYMGDGWIQEFKRTHFDFQISMCMLGAPADKITRRPTDKENSQRPVWDEEFIFELKFPEFALLQIQVFETHSTSEIYLPVSELRPGIRAVYLCDDKGCPYKTLRLLMKFEILS